MGGPGAWSLGQGRAGSDAARGGSEGGEAVAARRPAGAALQGGAKAEPSVWSNVSTVKNEGSWPHLYVAKVSRLQRRHDQGVVVTSVGADSSGAARRRPRGAAGSACRAGAGDDAAVGPLRQSGTRL